MLGRPTLILAIALLAAGTASAQTVTWTDEPIGRTAIVHMASAPFPHASRPQYHDDRVMIFVPADFRPGTSVDIVVQYHGHGTTIAATDRGHRYREQLARSRKNAILLLPQGPVNAADSGGGKHETPGGLARFISESLGVLVAEHVVPQGARAGRLVLSGHSGAYWVIGQAIAVGGIPVAEVYLHDALYGQMDAFEAYAVGGGRLVSTFTRLGGTAAKNTTLRGKLVADGVAVSAREDDDALATSRVSIVPTDQAHEQVTGARLRFTRMLRTSGLSDLGVARAELLSASAAADGKVTLRWATARSTRLAGWRVEATDPARPDDPAVVTQVAKDRLSLELTPTGERRAFRVLAVDDLGRAGAPSDTFLASGVGRARALVVDGFARTVGGGWTHQAHDFTTRVVRSVAAAGWACDTVSARGFAAADLGRYGAVLWLAGDQSSADSALDRAERVALASFVSGGGCLLVSGSEVAFDLGAGDVGADESAFLRDTLRATFAADTAAGKRAAGADLLAGVSVTFGGAGSPYPVLSPDVLAARPGAKVALRYANGTTAATYWTGAGSAVGFVGFPLECIDDAPSRDALVAKFLAAFDAVNSAAGRASTAALSGPTPGFVGLVPH